MAASDAASRTSTLNFAPGDAEYIGSPRETADRGQTRLSHVLESGPRNFRLRCEEECIRGLMVKERLAPFELPQHGIAILLMFEIGGGQIALRTVCNSFQEYCRGRERRPQQRTFAKIRADPIRERSGDPERSGNRSS